MAGRPTKLTPELLEKAQGYLETCHDTPVFTDKGAMTYVSVNLPSLEGFAIYLGIHKDTVQEWCKGDVTVEYGDVPIEASLRTEFSVLVKDILLEQGKRLVNNGLGGLYNPKIAGMMMSKHGYVEKTETDITTGGDKLTSPVLPELIAEADRLLKEKKLNS